MSYRRAIPHAWYHRISPRCDATTLARKEQCLFTATHVDSKTGTVFLCTTHAKIADFKVKRIREEVVLFRTD